MAIKTENFVANSTHFMLQTPSNLLQILPFHVIIISLNPLIKMCFMRICMDFLWTENLCVICYSYCVHAVDDDVRRTKKVVEGLTKTTRSWRKVDDGTWRRCSKESPFMLLQACLANKLSKKMKKKWSFLCWCLNTVIKMLTNRKRDKKISHRLQFNAVNVAWEEPRLVFVVWLYMIDTFDIAKCIANNQTSSEKEGK